MAKWLTIGIFTLFLLSSGCRENSPGSVASSPSPLPSSTAVSTPTLAPPTSPNPGKAEFVPTRTLPEATELAAGSRPFEGDRTVRQRLLSPLSPDTDLEVGRVVDDALTFDPAQSELALHLRFELIARYLLEAEQYEALDALTDTLRRKRILGPSGTWLLGDFYQAMAAGPTQDTEAFVGGLEKWLQQRPDSVSARCVLGAALTDWAWEARGGGYADTVTRQGWELFDERLKRALPPLEEAGKKGSDPYAYARLITVGMGLGSPQSVVRGYLDEARAIDPYHVLEPYQAYARYILPRWHGSAGQHSQFVSEMVKLTRSELGDGLYAVLMDEYLSEPDLKPDPKRCIASYEALLKRSPRSFLYFLRYADLSGKYLGAGRARELVDQLLTGKRKIPLENEIRLQLKVWVDGEFPVKSKPKPQPSRTHLPVEHTVSIRGIRWGMSREEVLKKLGDPLSSEPFGPHATSLGYKMENSRNMYVVIDNATSKVTRLAGSSLEIDGEKLDGGGTYEELVARLGEPEELKMSRSQRDVYLCYDRYHLVVHCSGRQDKVTTFTFVADLEAYLSSSVSISLEEWKQTWDSR